MRTRTLALAGIIGPLWFTTLVVVQGFLLPDYSHVRMPISALAAWPTGWIQILNFCVFGVLMTAFALSLHRAVQPTRRGHIACTLLVIGSTASADVAATRSAWRSHMTVRTHLVAALGVAVGLAVFAGTVGFASDVRIINMQDQCDPESFNAMFGPGTCVTNGGVSFDTFIAQVVHRQQAGAWRFTPDPVRVQDGQAFQAVNTGGEVHTFTEVDEFGGGFIPELNGISGNPVPTLSARSSG